MADKGKHVFFLTDFLFLVEKRHRGKWKHKEQVADIVFQIFIFLSLNNQLQRLAKTAVDVPET